MWADLECMEGPSGKMRSELNDQDESSGQMQGYRLDQLKFLKDDRKMENDVLFIDAGGKWHCRIHHCRGAPRFVTVDLGGSSCIQLHNLVSSKKLLTVTYERFSSRQVAESTMSS